MRTLDKLIAVAAFAAVLGLTPSVTLAAPGPQAVVGEAAEVKRVQYLEVQPSPPAAVIEDEDEFPAADMERCAAQFRSFEPDTGYYTTFGGERVLCPYLE